MIRNIGFALVLAMTATVAMAGAPSNSDHRFLRAPEFTPVSHEASSGASASAVSAPEIDPASMVAGLTLMLGSLAVMRGRRATKQ
jgi:hypothetical protein